MNDDLDFLLGLAVKAAQKAFPAWRKLSGEDRARYLFRIARILLERARERYRAALQSCFVQHDLDGRSCRGPREIGGFSACQCQCHRTDVVALDHQGFAEDERIVHHEPRRHHDEPTIRESLHP